MEDQRFKPPKQPTDKMSCSEMMKSCWLAHPEALWEIKQDTHSEEERRRVNIHAVYINI